MTAQYTATQQILPSNVMADTMSSKIDIKNNTKADENAFSNVLDNASKSYTDKSEQTNIAKSENYREKTKTVTEKNSEKTHTVEKQELNKTENKTEIETKEKESKSNTRNKIETDTKQELAQNQTENTEIVQELNTKKTIEQLLEEIQTNQIGSLEEYTQEVKVTLQPIVEEVISTKNPVTVENITKQANTIATEQLIANVEFENLDLKKLNADALKNIDEETLKKLIEQAKSSINTNLEKLDTKTQTLTKTNTESLNTDLDINNIQISNKNDGIEVVKTTTTESIVKELLTEDNTKLTLNLDESLKLNNEKLSENKNLKIIAPTDTIEEQTPSIKVTEEVASQIKDAFTNVVENKDNTSKIKNKVVETMTTLQDKEILVTESNVNNQSSNNAGLNQNNAGETAIKLAVETNSFNTQTQSTETFINKLDAQFATKETNNILNKSLDQNNILSQITSKFEQLQQSNNKVSIVLQPESLGKVSVEIMNTKDGIVAKMTTDTQQVKELFDKSIESLKSNLSAQGVNVNNIKVECTHESTNNAMNFERDQFNQSFNNQQNSQNQTNKSEQNIQESYGSEFGTNSDETAEDTELSKLKNTETIIKHNGKVDYSV